MEGRIGESSEEVVLGGRGAPAIKPPSLSRHGELSDVLIGRYLKICEKIPLSGGLVDKFIKIYATIAIGKQFGYKRGTLPGLTSVIEATKTIF